MPARLKILFAIIAIFISTSALADLAIIVNPNYNDGKLDTYDIKKLFLGERQAFPDGLTATPIHHSDGSPDRKQFLASVLRMNETAHLRHWRRMISTGRNNQPMELSSHKDVLTSVANTSGSISYVDARMVNDKVKVLMVIDANGLAHTKL